MLTPAIRHCASLVLVVAACPAWGSQTSLDIGADIELNSDYQSPAEGDATYTQSGRVKVSFAGEYTRGDEFIRGVGQPLINKDGSVSVDDAYLQFGNRSWDIQAGRFEAMDIVPVQKDTILVNANGNVNQLFLYRANNTRGRISGDGGQFALHFAPSDAVTFELATIYGDEAPIDDTSFDEGDDTTAIGGVRPAVSWKVGDLTLVGAFEAVDYTESASGDDVTSTGGGLRVSYEFAGGGVINAGVAVADNERDTGAITEDGTVTSFVVSSEFGPFGIGYAHSELDSDDVAGDPSFDTIYTGYTVPVLGFDRASATLAGSYSTADDVGDNDSLTAVRLRFNYVF